MLVVDFGTNAAGVTALALDAISGPAGANVTLRHGEVLQHANLPDVPPELSRALGPDGVQALWAFETRELIRVTESAQWYFRVLPRLVTELQHQARLAEIDHEYELKRAYGDGHNFYDYIARKFGLAITAQADYCQQLRVQRQGPR